MIDEYLDDVDKAFLGLGETPSNTPMKGTKDDAALKARFAKARKVSNESTDLWSHIRDSLLEGAIHSGLGAEPVARANLKSKGKTAAQINRAEKKVIQGIEQRRAVRDAEMSDVDALSPANIGKWAVDLAGNIVGGTDPTYILGPGNTALKRVLAQAGINLGVDTLSQAQEVRRGIKEEYDPRQGILAAGGGAVLQGAGEVAGRARTGRMINRGIKQPGWQEVNNVIVNDLEGGGTLARPKVSPKGAMGPQQVMPETARKPGFGIRPWNGKTQADLARVGRQYSAAMMDKYDGNVAKVLAAYNAGPGKVDSLIKQHGDNWMNHLPGETKAYVRKGMDKLNLGDIPFAGREARIKERGRQMARMDGPELEAQFAKDQAELDHISSEGQSAIENSFKDIEDQAFDNLPPGTEERLIHLRNLDSPDPRVRYNSAKKLEEIQPGTVHPNFLEKWKAEAGAKDWEDWAAINRDMEDGTGPSLMDGPNGNIADLFKHEDPNFRIGGPEGVDATDVNKGFVEPTTPVPPHLRGVISQQEWRDMPDTFRQKEAFKDGANARYKALVEGINKKARETPPSQEIDPLPTLNLENVAPEPDVLRPRADQTPRMTPPPSPPLPPRPGEPRPEGFDPSGGPMGGADEPAMKNLLDALKAAKKAGPEQRKARREELKKRVGEMVKRRQFTEGEQGLHAEKAALKGEMPHVDIEPLRDKIPLEDQNKILLELKNSRKLGILESVNARDAFLGLLDGKLPTKSEMALLYRVYPDLVKGILAKRPWQEKAKELLLRAYETSRAQMGSGDVSFGGRQGLSMISRPEYWTATAGEFKALSPAKGDQVLADQTERIVQSPHYGRAQEAGLHLMDLGDHGAREEYAPHGLVEEIPILGQIPKASNRAYTYMANELRFGVFSNLLDKYQNLGIDIDDPSFLKTLGEYINTFTGRGQFGKGMIGKKLNQAMPAASLVLFAPRFVLSTFQKLNPLFWGRMLQHPMIAKEALRDASAHFAVVAGLLGLANQAGYEVDWDPRSPTGLKIRHGKTTYDVGGGMVQTVNFLSKMMTNTKISGKGAESNLRDAKYGEDTNTDVVARFIRTKLHPTLSYFWNAKEGENVVGQKFDAVKDAVETFFPMYATTMIEHIKEVGPDGVFALPAVAFGVGASNYTPPEKAAEPVSDEEFLNGSVESSPEDAGDPGLSAEDKAFLGL